LEPPREVPAGVYNYLIGNNLAALEAAKAIAVREGFETTILTSQNTGEAKIIAKAFMGIAKEIQDSQNPVKSMSTTSSSSSGRRSSLRRLKHQ